MRSPLVASHLFRAVVLWAAWIVVASATTPATSVPVVTAVDGAPFEVVRGAQLFTGTRGTRLGAGDLIRTQPGSVLLLEVRSGSAVTAVAALGPSTRIYWMDRAGGLALAVLDGWVKVDAPAPGPQGMVVTEGACLHAASEGGSYVMHVSDTGDEVFQERGSMLLEVTHAGGDQAVGAAVPSRPDQLTRRSVSGRIQTRTGADAAFVDALPPVFLDPLPQGLGARVDGVAQPQRVRDVTYADVSDWLAAPKEWRRGFVQRFRPRLKDPAFFHALDVQMTLHPEWQTILHPPAPTLASQQH